MSSQYGYSTISQCCCFKRGIGNQFCLILFRMTVYIRFAFGSLIYLCSMIDNPWMNITNLYCLCLQMVGYRESSRVPCTVTGMYLPTRYAPPSTGYMCMPISTVALGWVGWTPSEAAWARLWPAAAPLAGAGSCTHDCFAHYRYRIYSM